MPTVEAPDSESELMRRGMEILTGALPPGWHLDLEEPSELPNDARLDGMGVLRSPDGASALFVIEVKRSVQGRDVSHIRSQLLNAASRMGASAAIVVARYLSPPVRERLAEANLSFIDATGNVGLAIDRPGVFLSAAGADHDPWRGRGRPRGSLTGEPAARVVRTLLDFDRDWSIRELVRVSGASTGATYRVMEFLEQEDLVEKHATRVRAPDWQQLLRRWSRDYEFVGSNRTTAWIAPRGIDRMLANVAETDSVRYAVTGTVAAAHWAPYAPARAAMIYTSSAAIAAEIWDLRQTETGANVVLAEPLSSVVFDRSGTVAEGYIIAAPSQVAVDLMTGPGRNPSEAEELIDWMSRNEHFWRRREGPAD